MDYEGLMRRYVKYEVPLDRIEKKVKLELEELETLEGEQNNSYKQMNMYRLYYLYLYSLVVACLLECIWKQNLHGQMNRNLFTLSRLKKM